MKLTTNQIQLIYYVCRQAERSIDFAIRMDSGMSDLRSYYQGERNRLLQQAIDQIDSLRTEPLPKPSAMICLRRLCLLLLSKSRWIDPAEIERLRSSLHEFQNILSAKSMLSYDELIDLRIRFYRCQYELKQASFMKRHLVQMGMRVEHLGQNSCLQFASITHLLGNMENIHKYC